MSFSTYRSIFSRSFIKTYNSPEGTACIILCNQDKFLNKQYAQYWKCLKYRKGSGEYLSQVGIRLSCLLERVGLTQDQDADAIQSFLDVRNDSVHPRVSSMTIDQHSQLIGKAIQWVDEILLWRIGYNG